MGEATKGTIFSPAGPETGLPAAALLLPLAADGFRGGRGVTHRQIVIGVDTFPRGSLLRQRSCYPAENQAKQSESGLRLNGMVYSHPGSYHTNSAAARRSPDPCTAVDRVSSRRRARRAVPDGCPLPECGPCASQRFCL